MPRVQSKSKAPAKKLFKPAPKLTIAHSPKKGHRTAPAEKLFSSQEEFEFEVSQNPKDADIYVDKHEGDDDTLFNRMDKGKAALSLTTDKLIQQFQKNANKGIMELIRLIFAACNCECTIEPWQLDEELSAVFTEAVQAIPPEAGEYAVGTNSQRWKNFNSRFRELWSRLMQTSNRGPLWWGDNKGIVQHLKPPLACMSSSIVRSFRHTATVAVYACVDGLIDVAKKLRRDLEVAGGMEKKSPKKSPSKDKDPNSKTGKLEAKVSAVEGFITELFESVFVVRYRDTITDIRVLSISCLGQWIKAYPSFFLQDSFTKYVGWSLYDKEDKVREAAVKALQVAFATPNAPNKLGQFTKRFLGRITQMTGDVKCSVAAQSVRLISDIFSVDKESKLLDNDKVEESLAKIFDPLPAIRQEAARFFRTFLRSEFQGNQQDTSKINREKLNMVVEFMDCFNIAGGEAAAYVVDAMWDIGSSFLYDWQQVVDAVMAYLSIDSTKDDEESQKDQLTLGIVHGIMMKLNDKPVLPAALVEAKQGPKAPSKLNDIQKRAGLKAMSEQLASCLPDLMTKFHNSPTQIVWLTEIIQDMELPIYSEKQLDQWFHKLLDGLSKLFFDCTRCG